MPESLSTDQLLGLYKIAVEEYRFEVRLNWDRTAYYLTLNSGLIAIAVGLLKVGGDPRVNLVVASMFLIGCCASAIAIINIKKGHDYYRSAVVKKTLFEERLGLTKPSEDYASRPSMAIGTTIGQTEHLQILHNTQEWLNRPLRRSITFWIRGILVAFFLANAFGIAVSLWLYRHPPVAPQPSSASRLIPVEEREPPKKAIH
ncbi:MAG TPA: hypothetical protein VG204_02485 [Terriglobia bacterium]|nr:hypothetical protein [Terriglobia bacterium]